MKLTRKSCFLAALLAIALPLAAYAQSGGADEQFKKLQDAVAAAQASADNAWMLMST